ncbi:MAG TPA: DUF1559 domain-containing protein [Abditibacteriaceae bacterium]|jgi:prepilin-type N-terminal cleavage/methylation domain-containing protein/prepilin-type processing-associated H-X9-DG protein
MNRTLKKGFTLIELLVVIAIIAILASILFPVFARAREGGRRSVCLSNMKQMGLGMLQYTQDYDERYPQGYFHLNDSGGTGGYMHWTAMIQPYTKSFQLFVCPSDKSGGLAPTNFNANNNGAGVPTIDGVAQVSGGGSVPAGGGFPAGQDRQAPRLSYTGNEVVLPRVRNTADMTAGARTVALAAISNSAQTIMFAEMTSSLTAIQGSSTASGSGIKSHRTTNAITCDGAGTAKFDGESGACITATSHRALAYSTAKTQIDAAQTSSSGSNHHIVYVANERHLDGNNYAFADGHAKWYKMANTMNENSFLWGKEYCGSTAGCVPIVKADGTPVS